MEAKEWSQLEEEFEGGGLFQRFPMLSRSECRASPPFLPLFILSLPSSRDLIMADLLAMRTEPTRV